MKLGLMVVALLLAFIVVSLALAVFVSPWVVIAGMFLFLFLPAHDAGSR